MGLIIKKTIATLVIFLIIPLTVNALDWNWQPDALNDISKYFFWVTETVSYPWAIISSILFSCLITILIPVKTKQKLIFLWLILISTILIGQILKSIIKIQVAEPRPFVLWMAKEFNIDDKEFYSLSKVERKQLVHQLLVDSKTIPVWLRKHWEKEISYSFPSGHTIFATTWAFLAMIILGFRRHYLIVSTFILWAIFIEVSRLLLGMHHPVDLIFGSFIAWGIALICYFYARKWHIVAT